MSGYASFQDWLEQVGNKMWHLPISKKPLSPNLQSDKTYLTANTWQNPSTETLFILIKQYNSWTCLLHGHWSQFRIAIHKAILYASTQNCLVTVNKTCYQESSLPSVDSCCLILAYPSVKTLPYLGVISAVPISSLNSNWEKFSQQVYMLCNVLGLGGESHKASPGIRIVFPHLL